MNCWTGLAPWEFEFPFPGSLIPTFLVLSLLLLSAASQRRPEQTRLGKTAQDAVSQLELTYGKSTRVDLRTPRPHTPNPTPSAPTLQTPNPKPRNGDPTFASPATRGLEPGIRSPRAESRKAEPESGRLMA